MVLKVSGLDSDVNGDVNFLSLPIQLLPRAMGGWRALQTLSKSANDLESPMMGPGQEVALAVSPCMQAGDGSGNLSLREKR